jgi:hypothetical protein
MNIFMTGASGTGKTSLAVELCLRLGLDEAPSVSRTSPYEMGSQDMQDYVMHCVDYQCRTASQAVISRTPIDVYAYSRLWGLERKKPAAVAKRFLDSDAIILYLPKYWEPEDDGFRPLEGQDEVDQIIAEALIDSGNWDRIYTVENEDVTDRADNVIQWLNSKNYTK